MDDGSHHCTFSVSFVNRIIINRIPEFHITIKLLFLTNYYSMIKK